MRVFGLHSGCNFIDEVDVSQASLIFAVNDTNKLTSLNTREVMPTKLLCEHHFFHFLKSSA